MKKLKIEFSYISRRGGENTTIYTDVDEITINEHELIINASPVGTFPNIDNAPDTALSILNKKPYSIRPHLQPHGNSISKRGKNKRQ